MSVFDEYSQFYDIVYAEKDYIAECDFIEGLWRRFSNNEIHTVLDLGCGTGGHALPLVQRDYHVTGVDKSDNMLRIAKQKAQSNGANVNWICEDIRTVRVGQKFDSVISMFAVIGYQITNDDVSAALHTARRHLNTGGLFIFDVWFGPAVLTDRPTDRVKIIDQDKSQIIRLAQPEFNLLQQTVKVTYTLLQLQKTSIMS